MFKNMLVLTNSVVVFLYVISKPTKISAEECSDFYEKESCEVFRARSLCSLFRRYCRLTCNVCQPPTTTTVASTTAMTLPFVNNKPVFNESNYIWSDCTKTCGAGTQYRFVSRLCRNPHNPRCERRFRECNTAPCFRDFCYGYRLTRRYTGKGCCSRYSARSKYPLKKSKVLDWNRKSMHFKNEWPWMVMVTSYGDICSGVLIHKQWVLTPAHCVTSGGGKTNARRIYVYIGITSVSEATTKRRYSVLSVVIHPRYSIGRNDIALLKLCEPASTKYSSVISLPRGEKTPIDSSCVVAGWGSFGPFGYLQRHDTLESTTQQHLDIGICRNHYRDDPVYSRQILKRFPKYICVGSLSERNPICNALPGSVMFCQRCSSCDWYLAGVSSMNVRDSCTNVGFANLFSHIRSFEGWICKKIPSSTGTRGKFRCPYKYGP